MPYYWFFIEFFHGSHYLLQMFTHFSFSFNSSQCDLRHIGYRDCYWFESAFYPQGFLTLLTLLEPPFIRACQGACSSTVLATKIHAVVQSTVLAQLLFESQSNSLAWYLVTSSIWTWQIFWLVTCSEEFRHKVNQQVPNQLPFNQQSSYQQPSNQQASIQQSSNQQPSNSSYLQNFW